MDLKILILDDSKLARISLIKSLNALLSQFSCIEAGSVEEALSAVKLTPPDIALLDFNLPVLNGHYMAAELRKSSPNMPIAIISANAQEAVIERTRSLHASFISKPVATSELHEFLKSATKDARL